MKMKRPNWMYSCEKATYYIVVGEARKLSLSEKSLLATHLAMCKFCRRFKQQSTQLNHIAKKFVSHSQLSAEHLLALEQKIKENL